MDADEQRELIVGLPLDELQRLELVERIIAMRIANKAKAMKLSRKRVLAEGVAPSNWRPTSGAAFAGFSVVERGE